MKLSTLELSLCKSFALAMSFLLSACGGGGSGGNDPLSDPNGSNDVSASSCAFEISSRRVSIPTTLVNTDSACDYYLTGPITFRSDLTIEPGTTIIVALGGRIWIDDGTLTAVGTADQRITIRGESPIQGYWEGILLATKRPSRIEFVDIVDGGNADSVLDEFQGGLIIRSSVTSLVDTSISNSFVVGLRITGDSVITEFSNNRFFGNSLAGIVAPSDFVPMFDSASDFIGETTPNGNPYIQVTGGDAGSNDIWKKLNAPYFLDGGLSVSSNEQITVLPGVEFIINRGIIWVLNGGIFRNQGTATEPISINPSSAQAGSWFGFSVSGASELYLAHSEINGAERGVLVSDRGRVEISDTLITNSTRWAIECTQAFSSSQATLVITGNMRYENNALGNIDEECIVQ